MAAKAQPSHKVLRIGLIQGGKILEERLIRAGQSVTIGESTKNTFVLPSSFLPKQYKLFVAKGPQYHLVFTEQMQGKVSINNQVQPLNKLMGSVAKKRGDAYWLSLNEKNRGKVQVGNVTILFQFVQAPPEPKRVAVSFSPYSLREMDWVFWGFFLFSCVINAAGYIYIQSQPPPGKVSIEDIPDRFTQVWFSEDEITDPTDIEEDEEGLGEEEIEEDNSNAGDGSEEEDGSAGGAEDEGEQLSAEELRAQRKQELMEQGLAALIGTTGDTQSSDAVADLLADGGNLNDNLDAALASASGIKVAQRGEDAALRTGGGGTGEVGSISDMAGVGGGEAGSGNKGQKEVQANVGGNLEITYGDAGDVNAVKQYVSRKKGQIKACYEEQLKANPDLAGKVEITWTVRADGSVGGASVASNTTGNKDLENCILRRIKRWKFPEGEDEFEITYPFNFFSS